MTDTADDTFRAATGLFTVGMLLPAVPAAVARESLAAALRYEVFLVGIAVGFGLAALALLERWSLDRATFVFVALVWPWLVGVGMLLTVLLLNQGEQLPQGPAADAFHTLTGDPQVWGSSASGAGPFGYGVAYAGGGVAAAALSILRHRLADGTAGSVE